MKTKELRIGNLLQDQKGNLLIVCEIRQDGYTTSVVDRSKFPLQKGWKADPITLTEDWLIKLGFHINENGEPEKDTVEGMDIALSITINTHHYKFSPWFVNKQNLTYYIMGVDIEYVHQLQNLYFALTGNELTI